MSCRRIENLIPLYVGGDLESEEVACVSLHLESCDSCSAIATQFRESRDWLLSSELVEFSEAELEKLKQGVMSEIQRKKERASLIRYFADRWTFKQMIAATAMMLAMLAALATYLYYASAKSAVDQPGAMTDGQPALKNDSPGGEQKDGSEEAPRAASANQRNIRQAKAMKKPHRKFREAQAHSSALAAQKLAAQTNDRKAVSTGVPVSQEMLRIEIQTADPNIRIIWFAPKEADSNQSKPVTD